MSMIFLRLKMTTSHAALFVAAPGGGGGGGDGTQWDFSFANNSGHLLTCGF
jgi:hypothetical protein